MYDFQTQARYAGVHRCALTSELHTVETMLLQSTMKGAATWIPRSSKPMIDGPAFFQSYVVKRNRNCYTDSTALKTSPHKKLHAPQHSASARRCIGSKAAHQLPTITTFAFTFAPVGVEARKEEGAKFGKCVSCRNLFGESSLYRRLHRIRATCDKSENIIYLPFCYILTLYPNPTFLSLTQKGIRIVKIPGNLPRISVLNGCTHKMQKSYTY